jgi:hypothetical protein
MANAVIAFGYSDGDELILGHFNNGKFIQNIKVIENGYYANPSTAPVIEYEVKDRGILWDYLRSNYSQLLKELELWDHLSQGDEEEATKIAHEFADLIFLNYCQLCGNIKKTPRARYCLKCDNFTEI